MKISLHFKPTMEFLETLINTLLQVLFIYILVSLIGALHNHIFFEGILVGIIISLAFKINIIKLSKKTTNIKES